MNTDEKIQAQAQATDRDLVDHQEKQKTRSLHRDEANRSPFNISRYRSMGRYADALLLIMRLIVSLRHSSTSISVLLASVVLPSSKRVFQTAERLGCG
jgi:hypothetical protein